MFLPEEVVGCPTLGRDLPREKREYSVERGFLGVSTVKAHAG
jgi:hypothetical protein